MFTPTPAPPPFAALIPAAGLGTRLGQGPKAAVTVGGRSLLAWTINALAPHVAEIIVALPVDFGLPADVTIDPAAKCGATTVRMVIGGETRQQSVLNLLEACETYNVLVHDAARPFVTDRIIRGVQEAVARSEAATTALPLADSLVLGTQAPPDRRRSPRRCRSPR